MLLRELKEHPMTTTTTPTTLHDPVHHPRAAMLLRELMRQRTAALDVTKGAPTNCFSTK